MRKHICALESKLKQRDYSVFISGGLIRFKFAAIDSGAKFRKRNTKSTGSVCKSPANSIRIDRVRGLPKSSVSINSIFQIHVLMFVLFFVYVYLNVRVKRNL